MTPKAKGKREKSVGCLVWGVRGQESLDKVRLELGVPFYKLGHLYVNSLLNPGHIIDAF